MFDVDRISDFEPPTAGGPTLPGNEQWQHAIEVSAVKEEYAAAMQVVESSVAEYKKSGNAAGEAAAQHAKAKLNHAQGKNSEAKAEVQGALAKYRAVGDSKGEAACLHTLARLHFDSGKFDEQEKDEALKEAETTADEALEMFKSAADKTGQASVLNTLAKTKFAMGSFDDAFKVADKAITAFEEEGDRNGQAAALLTKSIINLFSGNKSWDEAAKLAKQAIDLCKQVTKPSAQHREADAWLMVCAACIPQMKSQEALQAAKAALSLMETLGGDFKLALALRALAFTQAVVGNIEEAVAKFDQAIGLAQVIGDKHLKATLLVTGSLVHRVKLWCCNNAGKPSDDSYEQATRLGREATDLFAEMGDEPSSALARVELAQAMIVGGSPGEGVGEASIANDYFKSQDSLGGQAIAMLAMAEGLHVQGGQAEVAHGCAKAAQDLFNKVGGAGEGFKAAGELLDTLEMEIKQQRQTAGWGAVDQGIVQDDPVGFGAISRATYTKLFALTMYMPDRPYEVVLDAPLLQGIEAVMASMARQQQQAPRAQPSRARGGDAGRSGPTRAEGQALRPVPLKEPERLEPAVVTPAVLGTDVLGGRSWDCPEDVHARMLELATRGDLPVTKPEQRAKNCNKRPTFYGAPEWREAVKMGYIHPDIPAPRGLKWRKVTMGWKLLEA